MKTVKHEMKVFKVHTRHDGVGERPWYYVAPTMQNVIEAFERHATGWTLVSIEEMGDATVYDGTQFLFQRLIDIE